MLRRLFLALLALCLSAPALAGLACHTPPQQHTMAMKATKGACHDPAGQQDAGSSRHDCIGCIARYDGVEAPAPEIPVVYRHVSVTLLDDIPQEATRPETPPPRS